jgi:hypothetical protein
MLFKKKSSSSQPKKTAVEFIASETGEKALAFGLQWRSVVTTGGRDAAMKMARSARSTHYIYRGQQAGFGTLPGRANERPPVIYPASVVAARHYAGDSIFAVDLGNGCYWLAFTRNGSPTSTDRFYRDIDDALALSMLREQISLLEAEGARITVYTNIDNSGLEETSPISIEELMDAAVIDEERLIAISAISISIPKPVLVVLAIAVLGIAAQKGYGYYKAQQRAKLAKANAVVDEDPTVAWERSIEVWKAKVSGHNARTLEPVRASIAILPAEWDGWVLKNVNCTAPALDPAAFAVTSLNWTCGAGYERNQTGILTREMKPRVPANWTVAFSPLNLMSISWTVSAERSPMSIEALPNVEYHKVETVSRLQALAPAFTQVPAFTFAPVEITPPVSASGKPYPSDPRAEGIASAQLKISGPMRSIDALLAVKPDVSWQSISMNYASDSNDPALRSSSFLVEVNGVMYAKN